MQQARSIVISVPLNSLPSDYTLSTILKNNVAVGIYRDFLRTSLQQNEEENEFLRDME